MAVESGVEALPPDTKLLRSQPPQLTSEAMKIALQWAVSIGVVVNAPLLGLTTLIGTTPVPNARVIAAWASGVVSAPTSLSTTSTGFVGFGAPPRAQFTATLTMLHSWDGDWLPQCRSKSWPLSMSRPAEAGCASASITPSASSANRAILASLTANHP